MAKKMVGLSRALKIEWLNKVVSLVNEGMAPENIKEALDDYIGFELTDKTNIQKARNILMNMWVYPFDDEKRDYIRKLALELIREDDTYILAMHWCMFLLTYQVFVDATGMIGKISSMQNSFSLAWLKDKMFEEWGERTTLYHALDKIMQTLRQIGAVESKNGIYTVKYYEISDETAKKVILKTILALKIQAYYEPSELTMVTQMFPFKYTIAPELIFGSQDFEIGNFGGSPVVVG